jgi:hypothetical protein
MAVLAACIWGGYVSAHHSFAAEFDAEKPARLVGVITRIEWTNPHSYFVGHGARASTDRL